MTSIKLPDFPIGDAIPRVLHQHFLVGDAEIPSPIRPVRDALRDANPDWTYRFWDEALPARSSARSTATQC